MISMSARLTITLRITSMLLVIATPEMGFGETQAQAPSSKATEAIRSLDSEDAYERQAGFLRLEALREPSTATVIRSYLDHRDPDRRAYSLRALAAVEGSQAIPVLLQKLKTDRAPQVRRAALLGLEVFQKMDPAILPAFLQALRDRDTEVRMTAVDAVSRINDPRAREAIQTRYRREHRGDVRRVLELAMKRLGS